MYLVDLEYSASIKYCRPCSTASPVPLGTPLMDTMVEVRDERGCLVTEGEGQVFIGGTDFEEYTTGELH